MKDPIHDLHFIPFATALRLKDAGYSEESLFVYRYNTKTKDNAELICLGSPKKNIELKEYSTVAALTYDEAAEWLKEKFHFVISLFPTDYNHAVNKSRTSEMIDATGPVLGWTKIVYQLIFTVDEIKLNIIHEKEMKRTGNKYIVSWKDEGIHLSNSDVSKDYYKAYNECINLILDYLLW